MAFLRYNNTPLGQSHGEGVYGRQVSLGEDPCPEFVPAISFLSTYGDQSVKTLLQILKSQNKHIFNESECCCISLFIIFTYLLTEDVCNFVFLNFGSVGGIILFFS